VTGTRTFVVICGNSTPAVMVDPRLPSFFTMTVSHPPMMAQAPVVELRQYTLEPGTTSVLLDVFERNLVESQEAVGMRVGGLFEDLDRPDRFVWMRGFASMATRHRSLNDFYTGDVWREHGPAANETMIDSDDVLLLRPTQPAHPPLPPRARPVPDGPLPGPPNERVVVEVWGHEPGEGTCEWLASDVHPVLEESLGTTVATWRTEPAENTFPGLPVRNEHVFVWTATFPDEAAATAARTCLHDHPAWRAVSPEIDRRLTSSQLLRLRPSRRSEHPAYGPRP
jgi:hypothetical protein